MTRNPREVIAALPAERRVKIAAAHTQKPIAEKKKRQLEEAKRMLELDRNLIVIRSANHCTSAYGMITALATAEPRWLVCVSTLAPWPRFPIPQPLRGHGSQFFKSEAMNTEKFGGHQEGWRTLWLAIAGVMAITLTWNVLMLTLNGISY